MTTSPHNPMLVADFLGALRAVQAVAAEQHLPPHHPHASHDAFLARRHAMRPPRVSSLTTKLTSSLDLPANNGQDEHPPTDDTSSDPP